MFRISLLFASVLKASQNSPTTNLVVDNDRTTTVSNFNGMDMAGTLSQPQAERH